jgi:hypothetical protein
MSRIVGGEATLWLLHHGRWAGEGETDKDRRVDGLYLRYEDLLWPSIDVDSGCCSIPRFDFIAFAVKDTSLAFVALEDQFDSHFVNCGIGSPATIYIRTASDWGWTGSNLANNAIRCLSNT